MKKKLLIIPSVVLCFAALASCGKNNQEDKLVNGFESSKYEQYLQVPSKLSTVDQEYGLYVATKAIQNLAFAKSVTHTTSQIGTSSFNRNLGLRTTTPFANESRRQDVEVTIKQYDDENSIASITESMTETVKSPSYEISATDNTFEYLSYVKDRGDNLADIYEIIKGSSKMLEGGEKIPDLAYKFKRTPTPIDIDIANAEHFSYILHDYMMPLAIKPIKSVSGGGMADFPNLSRFLVYSDSFVGADTGVNGGMSSLFKFYLKDENTLYLHASIPALTGYVLSPNSLSAFDTDPFEMPWTPEELHRYQDVLISAYQIVELTAKFDFTDKWLCDYVITASKAYVTKDANFKPYDKAYCLASLYSFSDANYKSLGSYGNIDESMEEYYPSGLDVGVNIKYGEEEMKHIYTPDDLLEDNFGIYDFTVSARKSGLIPASAKNTYFFYGAISLPSTSGAETKFNVHAFKEEEDTVDIFKEAYNSGKLSYNEDSFELDTTSGKVNLKLKNSENQAGNAVAGVPAQISIFITKNNDGSYTVDSCTVELAKLM